jgi:hypothetical protein
MNKDELDAYAREGTLPEWFPKQQGGGNETAQ